MYYIGIDLGTTGCKSIVYDELGHGLGDCYIEYSLIVVSQKEIEQDSDLIWKVCCDSVKEAVKKSGIDVNEVRSLSISSQGISILLVDKDIKPLGHFISWLDVRAEKECALIRKKFSDQKMYKITGKRISPTYTLPKILWLMKHKSADYKKAYKMLMPMDFLLAKMTGNFYTDHTMAGGTMFYNIAEERWDTNILKTFGISEDKLPEIKWAGESAGPLTEKAAADMGLVPGINVAVGGQDQKISALFIEPDSKKATLSLGTAGAAEFVCDKPVFDSKMRIPTFTYIEKGKWCMEAVISTTGVCQKWLRNTLFADLSYKELDQLCEGTVPGCNGLCFYPHMEGASSPHWNSNAHGGYVGLSLHTGRGDFIRALQEGIAYQLKENLDVFERLSGKIDQIDIFGGGSCSRIWCQIISDITGKIVCTYSVPEIGNMGAAKVACMSVGGDVKNFGRDIFNERKLYSPIPENVAIYEKQYKTYKKYEKALLEVSK